MPRPTLVTGAAGFAGSHLLDLLALQGEDTIAWHRPGGSGPRAVDGVRWQAVDLRDQASVRAAIQSLQPGRVYHCAGAAHVGEAWDSVTRSLGMNVLGTHHLVEAVRDAVPDARVLNISSALVYAPSSHPLAEHHPLRPASPYGLTKLAQELVGEGNAGRPPVCVSRPFNHFGPRQDPSFATSGFARRIAEIEAGRAAPEIPVGNLDPLRDVTDVRDTVRAYQLILERGVPGRAYNVCRGQVIAVRELLALMLMRARVPIRIVQDPSRYRPNDLPIVHGDPTRIREELGWTPVIPLEQTIDELLDFWRERARSA
jgi:GDP-4-dehydro-6-deoxy-D-mannose reductase